MHAKILGGAIAVSLLISTAAFAGWREEVNLQKRLHKSEFQYVRHINGASEPRKRLHDLWIIVFV